MAEQPPSTANPTTAEGLVRDPLSAVTRKERLYLLAVSMIGIAMVRTNLVPTKIATFGIELDKPNRSALLFLLALVTIYFFAAFVIYAASDYIARREVLAAMGERQDEIARYQIVARTLNTSVEDVRKVYDEGALRDRAYKEYRNAHRPLREFEDSTSAERGPQPYGQMADSVVSFLEGRRDEVPPNLAGHQDSTDWYTLESLAGGSGRTRLVALMRVSFEFLLPLLVSAYAIYALVSRALL